MAAPKVLLLDIDAVREDPNNARTHDDEQVDMLAGLIRRFGFTNPALVDVKADKLIVAGHCRRIALKRMFDAGEEVRFPGGAVLPAGKYPALDCSGWSDDERAAYALADNQAPLLAGWDVEVLGRTLDDLTAADFDVSSLGFDFETLDSLGLGGGGPEDGKAGRTLGDLEDSNFSHVDRFGVIVECKDEAEQQAVFERLRDEGLDVKVVVV